ncbi:MAG: hypothetical protein SF162_20745 [bacterium]|nr:hypothetical protein [bacterium]
MKQGLRVIRTFTAVVLFGGMAFVFAIGMVPPRTAAQQPPPTLPPVDAPPTLTPSVLLATLPPPVDAPPQTGSGEPALDPVAAPILTAARQDLEILATDRLGSPDRPEAWRGVTDTTQPQYPIFLRLDLELLADTLLGAGERPDEWTGLIQSVPFAIARDIRHDLELLADAAIGASTLRPGGWTGDDPIYRCGRAGQNLLFVLERLYAFSFTVDYSQPNYCDQIENAVNGYVELTLIQPQGGAEAAANAAQPYQVETSFVIGFADINAAQRYGIIPAGTGFTPVGRSGNEFSNMMLITGTNFQVYTDYTYTPVTTEAFEALTVIDPATAPVNCTADWCAN